MEYFVKAIPIFFLLILVEWIFSYFRGEEIYNPTDAINNLSCGILMQLVAVFGFTAMSAAYVRVYETVAPRHLAPSFWTWIFILIGVDFFYYWFHRVSHRSAFFWASHVVHHQSEEYNLSVALRQSALGGFFSWVFYLPLAALGFPPEMFAVSYSVNLLYQFWIHTRAIKRLGALEWVLNTPSHHRVHHGRNPKYLDKNYAGALIVWDRWFGTFQPEEEEPTYGIVKPLRSWNPVWANFHVWVEILRRKAMPASNPDLTVPKYAASRYTAYRLVGFIGLLPLSAWFFSQAAKLEPVPKIGAALFILLSVLSLGALAEEKPWAWWAEISRWIVGGITAWWLIYA
jgi:sterol desaturase/sphingolipid hydroxylase (fatty acid hydroxylase superfamily)